MFLDVRHIAGGTELGCDLCIVGAGAAGITIARELADSKLSVLLLESGGLQLDSHTQDLYSGENSGRPYPIRDSRLRYFGGATNHWWGWCRPLDQIDFEEREGLRHSGWPLSRAELDPYYARAQRICQLGPFRYDTAFWAETIGIKPFSLGGRVDSAILQFSPPTRFGEVYRNDLRRSTNVRVLLNANLVGLELAPGSAVVRRARVATLAGKRFAIRVRQLVLAAGAIENARLLLASNDVQRAGIGN